MRQVEIVSRGQTPQMDDTDKLAVSLYGNGAAVGDTGVKVTAPADGATPNAGSVEVTAHPDLFNGTTWDRYRNNMEGTLLASAVRAASTFSDQQTNYNARGVVIFFDVTAVPGADTVTLQIRGYDPVSGTNAIFLTGAAIVGVAFRVYIMYPGAGVAANGVNGVNGFPLPRTWAIRVLHSAASNFTYSVGYSYVN